MDAKDDSLKKIGKGALYVFLGIIFAKFIGYLFKFITARLGTDQYGILSLGLMVYSVFNIVLLFGLDYGITRFTAYYSEKGEIKSLIKYVLSVVFVTSLIGSVLMFLFSDIISVSLFHTLELGIVLKILAIAVPFECLRSIFLGIIKGFQNLKYEFYARYMIEGSLRIILLFALVYSGFGIVGASLAYLGSIFVSFLFSVFFFTKTFSYFKEKALKINYGEVLDYSWPLMFNTLLGLATISIDSFMIGYFRTVSEVGVYNAVAPIARLTYMIPFSLSALLVPILVGLYAKKDEVSFTSVYNVLNGWVFKLNLPLFMFILFFPKELLFVLFGEDYVTGYISLIILASGFFIMYSFYVSREMLLALKKSKHVFYYSLIGVLLNIVLAYLLVPKYGIIGAAVSSVVCLLLISVLIFTTSYKLTKCFIFGKKYFRITFIALTAVGLIKLLSYVYNGYSFVSLLVLWIVFLIVYGLLLLVFRSVDYDDRMVIKDLYNSVKGKLNRLNL